MRPSCALAFVLCSSLSLAQTTESPPPQSDADLEEIQKALQQDAAANAQKQQQQQQQGATPIAAPETVTPAQSGGGGITLQSLNPDISVILDVAGAVFTDDNPLQGGGHDPTHTGFNLQQLELTFAKAVDPYFRFDSNLVFGPDGFELEQAYATTLDLPWKLQARAGKFLTEFGRINSTHPHAWDFVDQPFIMSRYFGGDANRGLGAEVSWLSPLPWYVELIGSATDATGEGTARSFFGADEEAKVHSPLDLQLTGAVKQFFDVTDNWSILWGLSAARGPTPYGAHGNAELYGTDLYIKYRPLDVPNPPVVSLQTEFVYRVRDGQPAPDTVEKLHDYGMYAQALYRFAQRWAVAARFEYGSSTWNRLGDVVADDLDPEWTDARQRYSANITFYPTEFSRLRLQGSMDQPEWRAQPIVAAFLAFEVAVGAHGAHKF